MLKPLLIFLLCAAAAPAAPKRVLYITHSAGYRHDSIPTSQQVLRDIGHKKGPSKSLVAFGYAGWGPGQLEVELARHDWSTISEDPALIFDDDRQQVWDHAMARLGQPL